MMFQISANLLDACVLSVVKSEDTYGYQLTQSLKDALDISESTLYPVLRRLQKTGFLTTYDVAWQGRNRRYYRITDLGKEQADIYRGGWYTFKERIDRFIFGAEEEKRHE